jgi:hypothetical protein
VADRGGHLSDSRPWKYSAKRAAKIVAALRAGNHRHIAARHAGIAPSTLERWLERGAQARNGSALKKFFADVKQAETDAEVAAVAVINKAFRDDDWKAALAFLQTRYPDRWGPKALLTLDQRGAAPPSGTAKKALDEYGLTAAQIELFGRQLAQLESNMIPPVQALTDERDDDD